MTWPRFPTTRQPAPSSSNINTPAPRHRIGHYRRGELVGVAVFSHPCSDAVLTNVFDAPATLSVELGRFVLLDPYQTTENRGSLPGHAVRREPCVMCLLHPPSRCRSMRRKPRSLPAPCGTGSSLHIRLPGKPLACRCCPHLLPADLSLRIANAKLLGQERQSIEGEIPTNLL